MSADGSGIRAALAVAVVAILPYIPNLGAPLQWDDRNHLIDMPFTRDWGNAPLLFTPEKYLSDKWPIGANLRPLADLTFFVDYAVWRHRPPGTRLFNILGHAACAILVLRLLQSLPGVGGAAAWWGAALWSLHPVHSEVVMCGIFRRASFATAFTLAALLAWRRERPGWTAAFYALGVLCKEQAAVLPILLAAHDLWLSGWAGLRRRASGHAGIFGLLGLYLAVYLWLVPTPLRHVPTPAEIMGNWKTMLAAMPTSARLIVWPWPLAVDYVPQVMPMRVWGGAAMTLAYLVGVAWTFRRAPVVSFGLAWAVIAHLPTAHAWPTGETYYYLAERFLYAPLIGIAVVFAWALTRDPRPRARVGAAGVAAVFACLILLRGSDWQSGVRLFGSNVRQFPAAYRSRYNLALSLQDVGRYEEAEQEYRAALAVRPDLHIAQYNRGTCLKALGRLDEAESAYQAALSLAPRDTRPMLSLGHLAYRRGRVQAAAGWYRRAVETVPADPEPHRLLGKIAFEAGRLKEADHEFAEYERLGGALSRTAPR